MDDFSPEKDRVQQVRKADVLAKLRAAAAAPGASDRMAAAAQAEPDPTAVHVEILRRRFPTLAFLHRPWGRGLPDLRSLADLATLAAYFSPAACLRRRRIEQHFRKYFAASPAQQRQMEIDTLGHPRRSSWSRLAFWR